MVLWIILIAASSLGLMFMMPSCTIDDGSEMHGWSVIQIPKVNMWKSSLVAIMALALSFPYTGIWSILAMPALLIYGMCLIVTSFPIQETGKKHT